MVLVKQILVNGNLRRSKSRSSDEFELRVADEFSGQPKEGLFEVVVGLGGDVVVLEILLSVEGNGFGLDFALLDIDFVAAKDDRDVFADTDNVAYGG